MQIKKFFTEPNWYRGNLHCHSNRSDGGKPPEEVFAWYEEQGFDFIALTDHQKFFPGGQYGNLLVIPGIEERFHVVGLGMKEYPDEEVDRSERQKVIDAILAHGGIAFQAHPYWLGMTDPELAACRGIFGVEVYNSVCDYTIARGYSHVHWDNQLSAGDFLLGLAVDDAHWHETEAGEGKGYVMVNTTELTTEHILSALLAGNYFSTQGPLFKALEITGDNEVYARFSRATRVDVVGSHQRGKVLLSEKGIEEVRYQIPPNQRYVRIQITDQAGKMAWSNPLIPFGEQG